MNMRNEFLKFPKLNLYLWLEEAKEDRSALYDKDTFWTKSKKFLESKVLNEEELNFPWDEFHLTEVP